MPSQNAMGMTEMHAPESTVVSSSIHSLGRLMALIPGLRTDNSVLNPPMLDPVRRWSRSTTVWVLECRGCLWRLDSFIRSSIHEFIHSFIHWFIHWFINWWIHSCFISFVLLFVYWLINWFIHSCIHKCIQQFIIVIVLQLTITLNCIMLWW